MLGHPECRPFRRQAPPARAEHGVFFERFLFVLGPRVFRAAGKCRQRAQLSSRGQGIDAGHVGVDETSQCLRGRTSQGEWFFRVSHDANQTVEDAAVVAHRSQRRQHVGRSATQPGMSGRAASGRRSLFIEQRLHQRGDFRLAAIRNRLIGGPLPHEEQVSLNPQHGGQPYRVDLVRLLEFVDHEVERFRQADRRIIVRRRSCAVPSDSDCR